MHALSRDDAHVLFVNISYSGFHNVTDSGTCASEMIWLTSIVTFKVSPLAEFRLPHSDWSNPWKVVETCFAG